MRRFLFAAAISAFCLVSLLIGASPSVLALHQESPQDETVVLRDLVMLGPAVQGLRGAGFSPTGTVKVFATEEEVGTDKMVVKVEGLPPKTDFTVFLHELSDIPFGSSQYIAAYAFE